MICPDQRQGMWVEGRAIFYLNGDRWQAVPKSHTWAAGQPQPKLLCSVLGSFPSSMAILQKFLRMT